MQRSLRRSKVSCGSGAALARLSFAEFNFNGEGGIGGAAVKAAPFTSLLPRRVKKLLPALRRFGRPIHEPQLSLRV